MTAEQYFKDHGISQESIDKFGLDWNKKKIIIPVRDENDNFLYNKYRHLDFDPDDPATKKYSFDTGSHPTIFNSIALNKGDYIFLTEGEMDCIRLDQEGIHAVTNTAGAATFKNEWVSLFENKKVFILYDNDSAGEEGARKVQEKIPHAFIIKLPPETKDVCEFFLSYNKAALQELVTVQLAENTITYKELCDIIDKWMLVPDKNVIKILLATLVAHFFTTDPLWMFFVAPPSGSKTEIISTIIDLPFVHLLSDLTPQTFASGMMTKEDPSLLLKLKNHMLVMKDFTTVLSMNYESRQVILSQLREIYDGRYSKAFGTGKTVDWEGRLSLIAGVTSIIDTQSTIFQVMGERFIMYRIPQPLDTDVADKALVNYGREKEMRDELRLNMKKYFLSLTIYPATEVELPVDIRKALGSLASLIVKARSGTIRDSFKKELTYIPTPEAPARFAKQLGTLIKALAVVERRKTVTWEDYWLTLRVALDVIPNNRMKHILALCGQDMMVSTTDIAQKTEYSRSGSEIILEDLTALQITKVYRQGSGKANVWTLSDKTREYFQAILPFETDDIFKVIEPSHPYADLIKEMWKRTTGHSVVDIDVPEDMDILDDDPQASLDL